VSIAGAMGIGDRVDSADLPDALRNANDALEAARRAREQAEAELARSQQAQERADKAIEDSRRIAGSGG
jgi:hypothetical protein